MTDTERDAEIVRRFEAGEGYYEIRENVWPQTSGWLCIDEEKMISGVLRPERRALYPSDWPEISQRIRDRAGNRCEGSPAYLDCRAANGKPHPDTGSVVVLTVAHLNHDPRDCRDENLKAWCQKCHLGYDRHRHIAYAAETRKAKRRQLELAI